MKTLKKQMEYILIRLNQNGEILDNLYAEYLRRMESDSEEDYSWMDEINRETLIEKEIFGDDYNLDDYEEDLNSENYQEINFFDRNAFKLIAKVMNPDEKAKAGQLYIYYVNGTPVYVGKTERKASKRFSERKKAYKSNGGNGSVADFRTGSLLAECFKKNDKVKIHVYNYKNSKELNNDEKLFIEMMDPEWNIEGRIA